MKLISSGIVFQFPARDFIIFTGSFFQANTSLERAFFYFSIVLNFRHTIIKNKLKNI